MYYGNKWKRLRANQCKEPGCAYNAFSHGYCKMHKYRWTSLEPIPKYKKKPPKPNSFGYTSQLEMFMAVVYLAPRPIICPISKRNITHYFKGEPGEWVSCCAHVLPKGKFPSFKLNPANIVLVDPEVHRLFDQGTELQRQESGWDFSPLYELQEQLKIEYEQYRNQGTYKENTTDSTIKAAKDESREAPE
jgi:hypothetical protein